MRFFQDMSEVPIEDRSEVCFPDNEANEQEPIKSVESSSRVTFSSSQNSDSISSNNQLKSLNDDLVCPMKDTYTALQSPLPLLYSWNPTDLSSANLKVKEEVQDGTIQNKTKRSKCIRKADSEKKKTIKQMRNRISAQKSRDRKRKEFDEMKEEADKLRNENENLKNQLQSANFDLQLLHKAIEALPEESKAKLGKIRAELAARGARAQHEQKHMANIIHKSKSKPGSKLNSKSQLLWTTFLLGCLCFTACIGPIMNSHNPTCQIPSIDLPPAPDTCSIVPQRELTETQYKPILY